SLSPNVRWNRRTKSSSLSIVMEYSFRLCFVRFVSRHTRILPALGAIDQRIAGEARPDKNPRSLIARYPNSHDGNGDCDGSAERHDGVWPSQLPHQLLKPI